MTGTGEARQAGAVQIEDLSLSFGGLKVLDSIGLTVRPGQIVGVVGPNGAGKSSLLNCCAGTYRPQSGCIVINGEDVTGRRPSHISALGVARTFQSVQLIQDYTVAENVLIGRHLKSSRNFFLNCVYAGPTRRSERRERARVMELLELVRLTHRARTRVSELPYGEQRRVEIARALASEPSVIFLDEPTSGMGQAERQEMGQLLRELNETTQLTQVLIEHDVNFVARLCQEVLVLDFGKALAFGSPETVFKDPSVVEAYVGL